ncbi:hypothetical protein MKX01_018059, partial [Papaver californicum]
VPIGHETTIANEYTDKQIIQEDVSTKYQASAVSFGEEMVQSSQTGEEVEMKQDLEVPVGIELDTCEASTGAEKVQKANYEKKEVNKPGEKGRLKVADFGWSVQSNKKRHTMCGIFYYLAP